MTINLRDVQDVYKDAGSDIIFATLDLKREDAAADKAMIADLAEHLPAFINSMNIRYPDAKLAVAFGLSRKAWDYLFPAARCLKSWRNSNQLSGQNIPQWQPQLICSSTFARRIQPFRSNSCQRS